MKYNVNRLQYPDLERKVLDNEDAIRELQNKVPEDNTNVLTDNETIVKNTENVISTVAVKQVGNKGPLRFFIGTKAEFDALEDTSNVLALFTDDSTNSILKNLQSAISTINNTLNNLVDGTTEVPTATKAMYDSDGNLISSTYATKDSVASVIAGYTTELVFEKITYNGTSAYRCTGLKEDANVVDVVIPGKYEGLHVREIANNAFSARSIRTVSIPGDVEVIGQNAFTRTNLRDVRLPSVKTVGANAFAQCQALRDVYIGASTVTIGHSAFTQCTSLRNVTFATRTELQTLNIGSYAFNNTAISDIELPIGTKALGEYAFQGCKSLKSIYIPATVTTVYTNTFSNANPNAIAVCGHTAKPSGWANDWSSPILSVLWGYSANASVAAVTIAQQTHAETADRADTAERADVAESLPVKWTTGAPVSIVAIYNRIVVVHVQMDRNATLFETFTLVVHGDAVSCVSPSGYFGAWVNDEFVLRFKENDEIYTPWKDNGWWISYRLI